MIKYNDDDVVVGYIKQLLHTTYLPNCPVYESDAKCYEGGLYIKNNGIYQFIDGALTYVRPYKFNLKIDNYTKVLKLENAIYDWHTHEYLGEYLRFLRDYFKLNLMSLYNCFSSRMPDHFSVTDVNNKVIAKSDDSSYSYYIIPAKFGHKYSIYIESSTAIEITPILYDKGYYTEGDSIEELVTNGHKKYSSASFKKPLIYDFLNTDDEYQFKNYYKFENDLKLLLKIPFTCNSSIVIFEDNLANTEGLVPGKILKGKNSELKVSPYHFKANKTELNFEYKDAINEIALKSRSQLTYINSHVCHPFADRLLEYLTDNAITSLENIPDNIRRVQHELIRRGAESTKTNPKSNIGSVTYEGIWEPYYKGILYNVANEENLLVDKFDILGYVDKDVEIKLGDDYDLYEDLWYEESK